MLMPTMFGENLFDDWFDDFPFFDDKNVRNAQKKLYGHHSNLVMKTDVKEQDNGYQMFVDLPGFTKDEIKASVEDGYLTITAEKGLDENEKDKDTGKYIRQERYAGKCQRVFYVGEGVKQADIKATFQHGVLTLFIPKVEQKSIEPKKDYIAIEG